jgi:hypothetical protein
VATRRKYRQENVIEAVTSTAARLARPTLREPASKSMPIAMPRAGRNPPNQ